MNGKRDWIVANNIFLIKKWVTLLGGLSLLEYSKCSCILQEHRLCKSCQDNFIYFPKDIWFNRKDSISIFRLKRCILYIKLQYECLK